MGSFIEGVSSAATTLSRHVRKTDHSASITAHSSQKFTLVINPHSGPGNSQFPSIEYITQIQNLTQYPNVQMVGYVRTGYATRDIEDVLSDISKYSGWDTISKEGVNSTALAMHGIFFDEAPHAYTPETADYMSRINQEAKDSVGVLSPKTVCSPCNDHRDYCDDHSLPLSLSASLAYGSRLVMTVVAY